MGKFLVHKLLDLKYLVELGQFGLGFSITLYLSLELCLYNETDDYKTLDVNSSYKLKNACKNIYYIP